MLGVQISFAQDIYTHAGAISAGAGQTGLCQSDIWSTQNNQAGLAFAEKGGAGFYYENRYNLKELAKKDAVIAFPTRYGTFGTSISYFGYSKFNESKYGLAYAKKLSKMFAIGIQLNYQETKIAEAYGHSGAFVAEIGFFSYLSKNIILAGHVYNPTKVKTNADNNNPYPMIVKIGILDKFTDKIDATCEVQKTTNTKPTIHMGVHYHIVKQVFIRIGYFSAPSSYSFGMGLELSHFRVDISSLYHPVLGMSNQVSLNYIF